MKTEPNDTAFPSQPTDNTMLQGLTKREAFAMANMAALLQAHPDGAYNDLATGAILAADALIEALNK